VGILRGAVLKRKGREGKGLGNSGIFGRRCEGNLEAATWVSRILAYGCQRLENPMEATLELWDKGMELGKRCQWITKHQTSKLYHLRFQLVVPGGDQNINDEALPLSKAIRQIDKRLVPVSIAAANVVHEVYGIVNYVTQLEKEVDLEVLGAAQVVVPPIAQYLPLPNGTPIT
jgi:hypothetical protein